MKTRYLTTLFGLAIVAIPAVSPASQPAVRLADLKPAVVTTLSDAGFAVLLTDPAVPRELSVVLPAGFTTLDVETDPFAI